MANVSVRNISETAPGSAKEIAAIRDVTFEIVDGEFATILSPSGADNRKVLRMIAGLKNVSAGDILVGGRRVNDLTARDRDIAMLFRNSALYPHMSVYENMAFGLKLRKFGDAEIKKRIKETASILRIEERLEQRPEQLSSEERQRVALGRAVVRQPKLFLLDEPLARLQAHPRRDLRNDVIMLHQRLRATMIYATQDPVEAMTMSDRMIVMDRGVVQQNGTPSEVYNTPVNLFVAGFVGSPPMNFVRGTLRKDRDALFFHEADGGTIELRLDGIQSAAVREFIGSPVVLGVRPEEIQVAERLEGNGRGSKGFPALVEIVESSGAETRMYLQTGAHRIVTSSYGCAPDRQSSGRRMRFEINVSHVHLFNSASARRIG